MLPFLLTILYFCTILLRNMIGYHQQKNHFYFLYRHESVLYSIVPIDCRYTYIVYIILNFYLQNMVFIYL